MRIPPDEIQFHPHSFADPDGRLFWWRGHLYRGIREGRETFLLDLIQRGILHDLCRRKLLVETELTTLALDGFALVLRQREVPFPSYPVEWPPAMLKEAALAYLRLHEALRSYNLALKDTHPWNLLFDGVQPLFVDVTSIVPMPSAPPLSKEKFFRYYLRPLALMAGGQARLARALMLENDGVREEDLPRRLRWRLKLGGIESLRIETTKAADSSVIPPFTRRLISELGPASLLDLSGQGGVYGLLACELGARAVVFDTDLPSLNTLFQVARERSVALLPLAIDFPRATPSIGFASHFSIAASQRLRCDLVVAHGLSHRLMTTRAIPPELVVEGLHAFTARYVLVEADTRLQEALARRFRCIKQIGDLLLAER